MKNLSKFISLAFHPVFLFVLGYLFIFFVHPYTLARLNTSTKLWSLFVVFLNLSLLPGMLLFILKRNGIISSYQLEKKNERNLTFLLLVLIFGIFVYQISKYSFPYLAVNYGIAILVSTASMWLINYKSKLSFHGIGAASLVALTSFVMVYESTNSVLPFLIISILLSGVIGSARLYLSAHKPFELYLGYGIGFIITLATLWISTTIV